MSNVCVFCGEGLTLLNRKELFCCTTNQSACRDCYNKMIGLPREEQGRKALATGRACEPEKIRSFLSMREENARKKAAAEEQAARDRISGRACPHCQTPMLKMGEKQFQLGEYDAWLGDLKHLAAGSLTLDLLCCPRCRRVEFFLPEGADV